MNKELSRITELTHGTIIRKWFSNYIGGIDATEIQKKEALDKINNAINGINSDNVQLIDFAMSYPDSLYLVKKYIDSIMPNRSPKDHFLPSDYRDKGFINQNQYRRFIQDEINKVNEAKIVLLTLYGPILTQLKSKNEIQEMLDILGINLTVFTRVINYYNLAISNKITSVTAVKNLSENYSDVVAEIIITDFLNDDDATKELICSKYKIGNFAFDSYIQRYIIMYPTSKDSIDKKLKNNIYKKFYHINDLIRILADYINNGIVVENTKISFKMLDYICLTDISIENLVSMIERKKDFYSKKELNDYETALRFFRSHIFSCKDNKLIDNPEDVLKQKNVFIINGIRYEPSKEDVEEIFELFNDNHIPKRNSLIYTALNRKAHGYPILPLLNSKEKTENPITK